MFKNRRVVILVVFIIGIVACFWWVSRYPAFGEQAAMSGADALEDPMTHQAREIKASGGYRSFDAPLAYFGLGANYKIQKVEVRWSDGTKTLIEQSLPANREYILRRKSSPVN